MAQGLANRARLGIPKVNQHPKLANRIAAPKSMSAKAFSGGKPAGQGSTYTAGGPGMITNNALKAASSSNVAATPGSTSSASAAPVVAPTAAPAASNERFAIPTWNPATAGEQDPRDSSYWANLAKLRFNDEQEYRQNNEGEQKENADYNYALQQAIQGRKVQERQLGENAISGNLSASGWLDRTQGEQETAYTGERSHALFSHEHELHAFNAAKHALEEGWGIDAAAELGEAVGRRTERERKAAEEAAGEAGPSESGGPAASGGLSVSNPGEQKASAFTHVAVANNKPVGAPQQATAFAEALKKGKKK